MKKKSLKNRIYNLELNLPHLHRLMEERDAGNCLKTFLGEGFKEWGDGPPKGASVEIKVIKHSSGHSTTDSEVWEYFLPENFARRRDGWHPVAWRRLGIKLKTGEIK